MFQPKSQQLSSTDSLIPMADGENDCSVFSTAHSHAAIRGKGLGLGFSAPSQSSLKYPEKTTTVSQKNALSDVNHKSVDFPSTASKGISDENSVAGLFSKQKQSFGSIKSCNTSNEAKAEIGRNVRSNLENNVSPSLASPLEEAPLEPMIQNYFDVHGEYPEIEYITTNQPSYDADWYYYQYPQMVPETFDRSFDSMDEVDIDFGDLCLNSTEISLSPVCMASSFEAQLNDLHFDSAYVESCEAEWEHNSNSHDDVFIPTDHPFFAGYSDDDDA